MTATKAWLHFGLILAIGVVLSVVLYAQEPTAAPPAAPEASLVDRETKWLVAQFGFAGMIFVIWWWDAKKIRKLTAMVEQYQVLAKNYEQLARDSRDTAIMCANVTSKVTEKMEQLIREHERAP